MTGWLLSWSKDKVHPGAKCGDLQVECVHGGKGCGTSVCCPMPAEATVNSS